MMQAKQTAWVFGATGLTGRAVVRALCLADIDCHAHLRPNSSSRVFVEEQFQGWGAQLTEFNWTKAELMAAFRAVPPSVVFLTLGTTNARAKLDGQGHRAVDYGLTKMVLDVLKSEAPETQIVYLSAVRSMGSLLSDYFKIRGEIEALLTEVSAAVLVVQPALIIGNRLDARPWEHRAAMVTNCGLDMLSAIGLKGMAQRYRSLEGETLGRGMVQLWLEQGPPGVANVGAISSAANRFKERLTP